VTRSARTNHTVCAPAVSRRATVLFAVLFLVVLATLSAATMLGAADAERAAAVRGLDELELQAAARSALLVYAGEIGSQRDTLLDGGEPELPETIEISRGENRRPIVVRLVPAGEGRTATPEAARLDLNLATAEMLASLPGVTPRQADDLVAARERGLFRSPNDAVGVIGSVDRTASDGFDPAGDSGANSGTASGFSAEPEAADPFESLTVYSADPQTQAGLGDEALAGEPRINLNGPWSDSTERAFEQRASEAVAATATSLFIEAPALEKPSDLARLLVEESVPIEDWPALLDTCTTVPDLYALGLVDLNRAPRAVLAALPGLDDAAASAIVSARERLGRADRKSVAWPLLEDIVSPETFLGFVDHVTTRSMQWRVTFRVSVAAEGEAGTDPLAGDPFDVDLVGEGDEFGVPLEESSFNETAAAGPGLVYEAVFDAAGRATRVAYLRERTAYEFVERLAAQGVFDRGGDSDDPFSDDGAYASGEDFYGQGLYGEDMYGEGVYGEGMTDPYGFSDGLGSGGAYEDEDAAPMTLEDLNASFFMDEPADEPDDEEAEPGDEGFGSFGAPGSFFDDGAVEENDTDQTDPADEADGAPAREPVDPRDNRLGRWKPERGGASPCADRWSFWRSRRAACWRSRRGSPGRGSACGGRCASMACPRARPRTRGGGCARRCASVGSRRARRSSPSRAGT